jgi:quercetin dioxygenase-like cupin family protein
MFKVYPSRVRIIGLISAAAIFLFLFGLLTRFEAGVQAPEGYKPIQILKTTKTEDGDPFAYPNTDKPEIISEIAILPPHTQSKRHTHPYAVFVYVMEGTLEVHTEGRGIHAYKTGEAFLHFGIGRLHQAVNNTDEPVKVLMVFMGEEDKPNTVNH